MNYVLYIFYAVFRAPLHHSRKTAKTLTGFILIYSCKTSQIIRTLRRGLRYLRDKMHYCGVRYERLFGWVDAIDQINCPPVGHRVRSIGG